MIQTTLKKLIREAIAAAHQNDLLPTAEFPAIEMETPKVESHGDFATNIALVSASIQKMPPRKIAEAICAQLDQADDRIARIEVAGPGFINFHLTPYAWYPVLEAVHAQEEQYGAADKGAGQRIQVEFVSANPTGPLHVGHGRGATVGDSVARILEYSGYDVQREYYINDSGRQIQTLGRSVYLRYQQLLGHSVKFPDDCYQGDYIKDLAIALQADHAEDLHGLPEDKAIAYCARHAADVILKGIRTDLEQFGVVYDGWFSEQSLYDQDHVLPTIAALKQDHLAYEEDGATWFKSTRYGDEKDRVVIRNNGQTTYFASDIAYHANKYERGFDRVIDVWGADHHGYIPRVAAAIVAGGRRREQFDVILIQLVNLLRAGEQVAMSTRAGEFVTLADVTKEVGRDAARFIFLSRHHESALDFDLEIAKQKSNDNPVYYVQYVHARIASIVRKGQALGYSDLKWSINNGAALDTPEELRLMKAMARFPDVIARSAELLEPHRVTFFLMDLAGLFHAYYNKHRVLSEDPQLAAARLALVTAVQQVIRNGLTLLGVSAPQKM